MTQQGITGEGKEGGREGGRERGREGEREGGREGVREGEMREWKWRQRAKVSTGNVRSTRCHCSS